MCDPSMRPPSTLALAVAPVLSCTLPLMQPFVFLVVVNRFCLVDDLERAIAIAKDFSTPESRVEPAYGYIVVDVRKRSIRS